MKNVGLIKKILLFSFDVLFTFISCIIVYTSLLVLNDKGELFDRLSLLFMIITVGLTILVFYGFRMHYTVLRYVGINTLTTSFLAVVVVTLSNLILAVILRAFDGVIMIPYSLVILTGITQFMFVIAIRYAYRAVIALKNGGLVKTKNKAHDILNVMIIGAGDAGVIIVREIESNKESKMRPMCFIDDDPNKANRTIENLIVYGDRTKILDACKKFSIDLIIIAIPSLDPKELSLIIKICQETKCKTKTMPSLYKLIDYSPGLSNLRDVEIKDLLGRPQIIINMNEIDLYLQNQTVLVTGGGGSIGSELCRQIVKNKPKRLIIVDIYENNAYDIEQEIKRDYPNLDLLVLIASVRDEKKIESIFKEYRPNIVFHAAAHKHVPLMETSPLEAVKNNVFGTLNVAKASDKYGVKRFVMISTDKAVNPTNIMGATKRICEMIVQIMNKSSNTEFVATRFGNVLGSNGSVIPLFKKQIANGGPVTVTDKNIVRYFMTIQEAVSLVLQAGSYARGGEIFVLDMGEPVKIYDLAVNLITLSGYTPNVDIKIEITGLRPGEKLYEEMLMDEEGLKDTPNKLIHIGKPIAIDEEVFFEKLSKLKEACLDEDTDIKSIVMDIVETYHPS